MEAAAELDKRLQFNATYNGPELGYYIEEIAGVGGDLDKYWEFLYSKDNGGPISSDKDVSHFHIHSDGYKIIMRYRFGEICVYQPDTF